MIDITVTGLKKSFGTFDLLTDVNFEINEGEKIGLIGRNGAGKTTLMKLLRDAAAGEANIDGGSIVINPRARVGLIDQIPVFPQEYTVEQVLRLAFRRFDEMSAEIARMEQEMAHDQSRAMMAKYGALVSEFEHAGGYDVNYELERVTNGLSIDADMRAQLFYSLSGGEQTRVNLARVILEKSDILLLDEPTNHLDIMSTEWLGEYMTTYKGTVVLISHDRWFLDRVVDRIIEIENGLSFEYFGNYSYYAVEKERRYQEALKLWEAQMEEKERMEAMARRYRSWATEQAIHKAKVVEHKIERMTIADRPRRQRVMRAKLGEAVFRADEALKFFDVSKRYEDNQVLSSVSGLITGGERVCIYGANGCGKSTLLNIITGGLKADSGRVNFGVQTKWAYLPQIVKFDNMERSILDTLLYALPIDVKEARNRLGTYQFQGEDVFKPLSVLSGGELSRLKLCILMYQDLNFLILDEPTNHLDLASREWLEDLLEDFSGVLLFVSHDRYFVTRFATRVWELENGTINDYRMGFEEYRAAKIRSAIQAAATRQEKQPVKTDAPRAKTGADSPAKEQRRLQRRRDNAAKEAAMLEVKIAELDAAIEANSSDYEALNRFLEEKNELEERLLECYELLEGV
ncbi:MAG: ABC-F family ATP-binding cassette domain-containing protein [Ruminococcaceae bacterium]|nr:ABC-F family ATP-binding cassette domain-containing protein [Oscillospiraceae bacterium]